MDIAVEVGQNSMPAGIAKIIELFGSTLDVCDSDSTLEIRAKEFKLTNGGKATLIASYKNSNSHF